MSMVVVVGGFAIHYFEYSLIFIFSTHDYLDQIRLQTYPKRLSVESFRRWIFDLSRVRYYIPL